MKFLLKCSLLLGLLLYTSDSFGQGVEIFGGNNQATSGTTLSPAEDVQTPNVDERQLPVQANGGITIELTPMNESDYPYQNEVTNVKITLPASEESNEAPQVIIPEGVIGILPNGNGVRNITPQSESINPE